MINAQPLPKPTPLTTAELDAICEAKNWDASCYVDDLGHVCPAAVLARLRGLAHGPSRVDEHWPEIDRCADDIGRAAGLGDHRGFYAWLRSGARDGRQLRRLIHGEGRI